MSLRVTIDEHFSADEIFYAGKATAAFFFYNVAVVIFFVCKNIHIAAAYCRLTVKSYCLLFKILLSNFKSANMSRDFKGEEGGTRKSRKRAAEREEQLEYRRTQIMLETESSASISINISVPSKDVDVVSEHQNVMVIRT